MKNLIIFLYTKVFMIQYENFVDLCIVIAITVVDPKFQRWRVQ